MIIKIVIDSPFFIKGMEVITDWNFPHLPRIGEVIHPLIIISDKECTYKNLCSILTEEAKGDYNKYLNDDRDVEENFKGWIWDVICEANVVQSIHYEPSKDDYKKIIPIIYLNNE